MKLSIVILNYKSAGLTRQCVKGIFASQPELEFEVIVVDNDSGDGILAWLEKHYPQTKRIQVGWNSGYTAGNNMGLKAAVGEYALILNPDITVLPGKLEALVEFMDSHTKVGLAGPKLVNPDGSLQYSTYKFPTFWLPLFRRTFFGNIPALDPWLKNYQMMAWDHQDSRSVDWILGACLIVRKSAMAQVGLMDERFFMYVQETDWARRFWAKGWQVWYAATVEFVHFHERLSAQRPLLAAIFSKITWIHIRDWIRYFKKWRQV